MTSDEANSEARALAQRVNASPRDYSPGSVAWARAVTNGRNQMGLHVAPVRDAGFVSAESMMLYDALKGLLRRALDEIADTEDVGEVQGAIGVVEQFEARHGIRK